MYKIMIHTYPKRLWYVKGYLLPSLYKQGFDGIRIWNDTQGKGNLMSCVESFEDCGKRPGATWHLQDDVIISDNFRELADKYDNGIACGFVHDSFGVCVSAVGHVPVKMLWYSFPCIRVPNRIAGEFAAWCRSDALLRPEWYPKVFAGKYDDWFFRQFLWEKYPDMWIDHIKPNMAEHVDYLLGGSSVGNQHNGKCGATYWEDHGEEERLKSWLEARK